MPKGVYARPDFTGRRFAKLTVKALLPERHLNHRVYLCACDCGSECRVTHNNLNSGNTKSCGCLHFTQDGLEGTPIHARWRGMMRRCFRPDENGFADYGGRGITVCERWRTFLNFYADMDASFRRHSAQHGASNTTLERDDVNGNYEPANCRWATIAEQNGNKRTVRRITLNGQTRNLAEWARIYGVPKPTADWRFRRGWPIERVLGISHKGTPA